ncbi:hypothetical protein [Nocardia sp. NPDC006630]|uniref:hypothetical protein n=1 Tax=Nocardia sp. NPDC006630 TaxID=3157181 RepID=UPI0033B9629F
MKEITDAFVNFFDARTPAETKVGLLENGSALSPAIVQQSGSSMASGSAATVSSVSLDDATHASVVYTILMNGAPALPNQSGKAISIDGHWKVAVATYCSLLKMQGPVPAAC